MANSTEETSIDNTNELNQLFEKFSSILKALDSHAPRKDMSLLTDKLGNQTLVFKSNERNKSVSKLKKFEEKGVLTVTFGDTILHSTDPSERINTKTIQAINHLATTSEYSIDAIHEALEAYRNELGQNF